MKLECRVTVIIANETGKVKIKKDYHVLIRRDLSLIRIVHVILIHNVAIGEKIGILIRSLLRALRLDADLIDLELLEAEIWIAPLSLRGAHQIVLTKIDLLI